MPELPEVETLRRDLEGAVCARRVTDVHVLVASVVRGDTEAFARALTGRAIECVDRRAKHLLIRFAGAPQCTWALHLSLEGRLLLVDDTEPPGDGTKLAVSLDDGRSLRLWDPVSFASTAAGDDEAIERAYRLSTLGPEPIEAGFTHETLRARFGVRRVQIKPALLDQHVVAGVGNIYADEALWRARLHPQRRSDTLTHDEWIALAQALASVLSEGVLHRGTSAPGGLYRDLFGRKGTHQRALAVFRRAGRPCLRCDTRIERSVVGGRNTFACPVCQRLVLDDAPHDAGHTAANLGANDAAPTKRASDRPRGNPRRAA